jgi:hypothetical protein
MVAFAFRMGVGYEGATNRNQHSTVVREIMTSVLADQPTSYGVMLALDATGIVRICKASDALAGLWGFFVRPWPTQGGSLSSPINDGLGVSTPPGPAAEANVLKRGWMTVKLNAASPAVVKGQPVGVFIGTPSAGNPAGGVTGAAPGATVLAIPNTYFMGPAEAGTGITEIAYNI